MKKRIIIHQWLELKPYSTQTKTDSYYLNLANEVRNNLLSKSSILLMLILDKEKLDQLCCFLVSYFEDIISKTKIWTSFVNVHTQLYNKKLPFYNTDEYYENEINEQDVSFLIWYFLNTVQDEKFVNPYNEYIQLTANNVMQLFEKEYEYAPENNHLLSFYQLNENENDFYEVRILIDIILFGTYLFYFDTAKRLKITEKELIEKKDDDILMYLRENHDSFLHKCCTSLLALKGKEWAAEILGKQHRVSQDLLNMSQKISGFFLYKGQTSEDIYIEHIASGKEFNLTKKSFDNYSDLKSIDTIMFIGIVQWQNEWWFSGINTIMPYNPDLILDEKNSLISRMQVNFLDHKIQDISNLLKKQFDALLSFNNGSQIAFLPSNMLEKFNKDFIDFYNKSLNLSNEEKKQAKKRAIKEGYFGNNEEKNDVFSKHLESCLFFFNPKSGGEMAYGINNAFPLKINPYFNIQDSEVDIMHLLMAEDLSTELAMFCIDNCKLDLPFFTQDIGKKYLEDIDFLLRFWKKGNYFSKPEITFTGLNV